MLQAAAIYCANFKKGRKNYQASYSNYNIYAIFALTQMLHLLNDKKRMHKSDS